MQLNLTAHEQHVFDNAIEFTAARGGYFKTRTVERFDTLDEAIAYAQTFGDKRTMLYAVSDINFAHICNA